MVINYATYTILGDVTPLGWLAAQQACVAAGGHLASFASAAELATVNAALLAAIAAAPYNWPTPALPYTDSYRPLWVGLYEGTTAGLPDWRWSDATPLAFSGFGSYMYGASPALAASDCAAMHMDRSGAWSQQACSRTLQYLCKELDVAAAPPPLPPPPPATARQLQHTFTIGASTYTYVMQPRSFAAAQRYCASTALYGNGELAAITTVQEYVDIVSAIHGYLASNGGTAGASAIAPPPDASPPPWAPLPPAGDPPMPTPALPSQAGESAIWVGIRARASDGQFAYLDGTAPLTFTAWAASVYTGLWPVLSCVSLDPSDAYSYRPAGCGVELPFLCRASAANAATSPPPPPPPPPPLGSAPTSLYRGLYRWVLYDTPLPYGQAKEYCRNTGGYLASVHSASDWTAVWSYMTANAAALAGGTERLWLGYDQLAGGEAAWTWVDGGPSVYDNWGLPYTDTEGNDCAAGGARISC